MYGLRFREQLPPEVAEELDGFVAAVKAFMLREHKEDGTHDFTLSSVQDSIDQLIDGYQDRGQWWKFGPWFLDDPDAGDPNVASLLPPVVSTGTYDNWAPYGVDTSVAIEIEPDGGDVTLTGLKTVDGARTKRILLFRNRDSTNSVFLKHEDTGSIEAYRFDLPESEDVELSPGQNIWLYYDPSRGRWTAAITAQAAGGITAGVEASGTIGGGSANNPIESWWFHWQTTVVAVGGNAQLVATGNAAVTPSSSGSLRPCEEGVAGVVSKYRSAATTNTIAGWSATATSNFTRVKWTPMWRCYIKTGPSLAVQRILVGWGANNFQSNDFCGASQAGCGIRYSTSSSDGTFRGITKTTAGTVVNTDLGVTPAVDTEYELTIKVSATNVSYTIKNLTAGTAAVTTTVASPFSSSTTLGGEVLCGCITLENVAKDFAATRMLFMYLDSQMDSDYSLP